MREIVILEGKEADVIRLHRANGLAKLFDTNNGLLLESLKSFLVMVEYRSLLADNREQANGVKRITSTLITQIQDEINWAIKEVEKQKTKEKK